MSVSARPIRTLTFVAVSGAKDAASSLFDLCEQLHHTTHHIFFPNVVRSYANLAQHMTHGTAHIAWVPPIVAVELERAGAATIAFCCVRGGQTLYHSAIFARRDSPVRALSDLAGVHMAWVDRDSAAGYVVPRLRIKSAGFEPASLFGRETFFQTHAAVARAVLTKEADAGATYATLDPRTGRPRSAGWLEADAALDSVHLVATAGPIPADTIVLSTKLPADVIAELIPALESLPRTVPAAARSLFRADAFEPPRPAHFQELRRLFALPSNPRTT